MLDLVLHIDGVGTEDNSNDRQEGVIKELGGDTHVESGMVGGGDNVCAWTGWSGSGRCVASFPRSSASRCTQGKDWKRAEDCQSQKMDAAKKRAKVQSRGILSFCYS